MKLEGAKIPYDPGGDLAKGYNRAMEESKADWVLLIDHDVFLACNPYWFQVCSAAIDKAESLKDVGLLTCVTSGKKKHPQIADIPEKTNNIDENMEIARQLYFKHDSNIRQVNSCEIAGFFMLIKKSVWKEIKFRSQNKGIFFIDYDFSRRLCDSGYKIYIMPGLYMYHKKTRKVNWK